MGRKKIRINAPKKSSSEFTPLGEPIVGAASVADCACAINSITEFIADIMEFSGGSCDS
jgi:hypothetical protein